MTPEIRAQHVTTLGLLETAGPIFVPCPWCNAGADRPCVGRRDATVHPSREQAWRKRTTELRELVAWEHGA